MAGAAPDPTLDRLQHRLGHHFRDPTLLDRALTHSAASGPNNQRLEFLGDAILGAAASALLYRGHEDWDEGALSVARTRLVCQDSLAAVALDCGLPEALRVSPAVARSGAVHTRPSVLADAVEALLGAVFLDAGFDTASAVAARLLEGRLDHAAPRPEKDPKTRLQEWLHARGWPLPDYRLLGREGPANAPRFRVACVAGRPAQSFDGSGPSRRAAEQQAAAACLAHFADAVHPSGSS